MNRDTKDLNPKDIESAKSQQHSESEPTIPLELLLGQVIDIRGEFLEILHSEGADGALDYIEYYEDIKTSSLKSQCQAYRKFMIKHRGDELSDQQRSRIESGLLSHKAPDLTEVLADIDLGISNITSEYSSQRVINEVSALLKDAIDRVGSIGNPQLQLIVYSSMLSPEFLEIYLPWIAKAAVMSDDYHPYGTDSMLVDLMTHLRDKHSEIGRSILFLEQLRKSPLGSINIIFQQLDKTLVLAEGELGSSPMSLPCRYALDHITEVTSKLENLFPNSSYIMNKVENLRAQVNEISEIKDQEMHDYKVELDIRSKLSGGRDQIDGEVIDALVDQISESTSSELLSRILSYVEDQHRQDKLSRDAHLRLASELNRKLAMIYWRTKYNPAPNPTE